ncbi:DUF4625 domain-containing protein [Flavobacterium poyangense]|uniref:DUF4625 domain-containing protein n=1 Tax=Flavobacterium poyangense TaxID=2204302 RepID=UPI0014242651|nr:DUF4625 domain-containing protein [Flavobacterium sp. JXAS1]
MRKTKLLSMFLLIATTFTACSNDDDTAPQETKTTTEVIKTTAEVIKPIVERLYIGIYDSNQGSIGRDFQISSNITAGDRIAAVQIKILPKKGEKYATDWKFELNWPYSDQPEDTILDKQFDIPKEAPEGKYDFYFIVLDTNGSKLEIKEDLILVNPDNIPADPHFGSDPSDNQITKNSINKIKWDEKMPTFNKKERFSGETTIYKTKGDGILYSLLIKKSANYHPENIDNLDFKKVIVLTKKVHTNLDGGSNFDISYFDDSEIIIGTDLDDNNTPKANPITGENAWESGEYEWVVLYKNTTYNLNIYKSLRTIKVKI